MAEKERQSYSQSRHRNYVGARENEGTAENHYQSRNFSREQQYSAEAEYRDRHGHVFRSRPSSHDPPIRNWERGSHDRYGRNLYQEPYQRRRSSYREGSFSHPHQRDNEQESAGIFTSGSSTGLASPQQKTFSKVNGNNRSIPPSPRPSMNRSMKRSLEGNATKQPASSPSKPAETSAVISQSIVPNSGENQAEQSSQNSENGGQATSTNKDASNQQVSPHPKLGVSSVKNLPSLVQKTVLKKSEQSFQKSETKSRIEKKDEPKFIQSVFKNPHLYDHADPSYHNKELKKRSWTSIGKTFGHSADGCKSRWQTIRQRYKQWKIKMAAGCPIPKEVEQFVNNMSFLDPYTQESIQEKTTPRTESCESDQALVDSVAAELRRLSPDHKGLFKSRIHATLAEFSKVV